MARFLALSTLLDMQRIISQQLEDDEWNKVVDAKDILDKHIWIDDYSGLSIDQLWNRAQKMVQEHNVDLMIVDYVNLIHPETEQGRYAIESQGYRKLSRGLKVIARELNIPVLALAQITRKVNRSLGEVVSVLDAQDSSIENDADVVLYIHREDMHDRDTTLQNIADIIVTKHRNGIREAISLYCDPRTGRFHDLMRNTGTQDAYHVLEHGGLAISEQENAEIPQPTSAEQRIDDLKRRVELQQ